MKVLEVKSTPSTGDKTMNATPILKPLTPARTTRGTFARPADPTAITAVELPNGLIGYRVGPCGSIFANRGVALAFAGRRAARLAKVNAAIEAAYEESIERSWC